MNTIYNMDEDIFDGLLGKQEIEDEEKFCYSQGRRNAKIKIYEKMWMKKFRAEPTLQMEDFCEELDEIKYKMTKNLVHLTIGFPNEEVQERVVQWVPLIEGILESRSWVGIPKKKWIKWSFELGDSGKHPHLNFLFYINRLYTPGQIIQMLFRNSDIQSIGVAKNFWEVRKYERCRENERITYIHKEGL